MLGMEVFLDEIENLFLDPSYTREEILHIFRSLEKSKKPKPGTAKEVFADYREVMEEPRAILDARRTRLINRALETYTADDLKLVHRGCVLSPWHMGTDPNNVSGTIYNAPELLYRDAEKIEQFLGIAKAHKITPDAKIRKSDYDGSKKPAKRIEYLSTKRI